MSITQIKPITQIVLVHTGTKLKNDDTIKSQILALLEHDHASKRATLLTGITDQADSGKAPVTAERQRTTIQIAGSTLAVTLSFKQSYENNILAKKVIEAGYKYCYFVDNGGKVWGDKQSELGYLKPLPLSNLSATNSLLPNGAEFKPVDFVIDFGYQTNVMDKLGASSSNVDLGDTQNIITYFVSVLTAKSTEVSMQLVDEQGNNITGVYADAINAKDGLFEVKDSTGASIDCEVKADNNSIKIKPTTSFSAGQYFIIPELTSKLVGTPFEKVEILAFSDKNSKELVVNITI